MISGPPAKVGSNLNCDGLMVSSIWAKQRVLDYWQPFKILDKTPFEYLPF